jgi:tetratricopeptide (TPR) repeat protein
MTSTNSMAEGAGWRWISDDCLIPLAAASRMGEWYALATAHGISLLWRPGRRVLAPFGIGWPSIPTPMNPNREEALFAVALEKPAEKRAAFLDAICDGDAALRLRLESLLAAHEQPETLLATQVEAARPTIKLDLADAPDEAVGQTLGRYKLLEQIGEGGCGMVYVAEQKEPVRRKVALKVIKLGMDTKQVVARFEAERQALAMMDHPNIAKVLDAGTTDVGRPYFVMELVRGIRITDYCDQANLTTKERLDLFIKVCHAIQHAHQKGIIHRDIKPSNILVTLHDGVPVPKVIDFGIAKATQGDLTDKTIHTQFQQFIGTPAYMSPEQAELSGLDIDTRSDIYSLGVLLYELLAGSTPFDAKELMASGIDAMRKTIREKEPQRPSTRFATLGVDQLTTTAKRRSADTSKLLHQLKGDLDWIVMKCLEKDRQRRYETANGLAADINRHLTNEPVIARPPSAAYKFQKAYRRNKGVFAAGAAVAVALVFGIIVSAWQAVRATRAEAEAIVEKAQALTEKANAQGALQFIQEDVLSQASPGYQPDRDLTVRALLDRIAGRLARATNHPPLVEASIRQTLGSVYTELGDYPKAIQHFENALRVQRENLGETNLDTLRSLNGLATAHWLGGSPSLAEPLTRHGLEASQRTLGETNALTLQFMQTRAFVLMLLGETPWAEVEALFFRTLALHREVLGPDDPGTLRLIYGIGLGYQYHFKADKAERLLADALERARRVLGEERPITGGLMVVMSSNYRQLNQPEKAKPLALRVLELRRSTLGTNHPLTLSAIANLATVYVMQQQFDEARPLVEQILNLSQRIPLEKSAFLGANLTVLGWNYLQQGDVAQADTLCDLAFQAMRRNPTFNPLVNSWITIYLGAVRLAQQHYAEATTLLREGLRLTEKHDVDAGLQFYAMNLLGASLTGQKDYAEAEPFLLESCKGLQQHQTSFPPSLNAPRRIKESLERLVQLYEAWGKPAKAAEWKEKLAAFQQAAKSKNAETPPGVNTR